VIPLLALLVPPPHLLLAQGTAGAAVQLSTTPQDSARLLSQARNAQRHFENLHRSRLPRTLGGGGSCDERVGRICLRWDGGMDWSPSPEDSVTTAGREELLRTLGRIASRIPGDRWVLGQQIRYLGYMGRWREALALARTCRGGEPWWCDALQGYVLHRSGQVHEAMESFDRALTRMDPEEADEWRDPSALLDYPVARWLRDPGGLSPTEALDRFWRLSDPLFLTPGNEALTEHLSRRFGAQLLSDATLTMGLSWSGGLEQLLMRYGFVAGWERTWPEMGELAEGAVVEHHHPESRGLTPPLEVLEDPGGLPRGVWTPRDEHPRNALAPVLAPLVVEGQGQTAVFRRDGDLLVVARYGPSADTLLLRRRGILAEGGDVEKGWSGSAPWDLPGDGESPDTLAGLFLMADTGRWAPLSAFSSGGSGVLQLRAPPGSYLLSLEQWSPSGRWGTRIRHGLRSEFIPEDVPSLSDLVLLRHQETIPESLAESLPRMMVGSRIRSGDTVTVGWEIYGLGRRGEPLTLHLSLVEEEGSLIRRALKRIGLMNRQPVLTLTWTEGGSREPGPLFRAVDLELPNLGDGRYLLKLELEIAKRTKVVSHRRITVY